MTEKRENINENSFGETGESPIIERKEVQRFIKNREIRTEDFYLIEKLASFPVNMVILELHNLFNMNRENSGAELESMIKDSRDREPSDEWLAMYRGASKTELLETISKFYKMYGWEASYNLVRVLENL